LLNLLLQITVNSRIVVIGASDTGVSFLETLIFAPHLKLPNLYLISPGGTSQSPAEDFEPFRFTLLDEGYQKIYLNNQLSVIDSKLARIDRKAKVIGLTNGSTLPYDYLVLATGCQDLTSTQLQIRGLENVFSSHHKDSLVQFARYIAQEGFECENIVV
jgi:NADH dehydrogenase FAD-containing subunit